MSDSLNTEVRKCAEWMWLNNFRQENGREFNKEIDEMNSHELDTIELGISAADIFKYREYMREFKHWQRIMFITEVSIIRERVSDREIPKKLKALYSPLALSFQMMSYAARENSIEFKWLRTVPEPMPENFTEVWEECFISLVSAKEYLDIKGIIYPKQFQRNWDKCNEIYNNKVYIVNLGGTYNFKDIKELRTLCDKYGVEINGKSDSEIWKEFVI